MTASGSDDAQGDEPWVPLLVPVEDYLELAGLVADRVRARVHAPVQSQPSVALATRWAAAPGRYGDVAAAELARLQPWTIEDLVHLASSGVVTARRWSRAMDVCAAHVNQFLSTEQIAQESGMTVNEWRDASRKMSRLLDRHFPSSPQWPLCAVFGRQLGRDEQVYWAINRGQAGLWERARSIVRAEQDRG